MDPNETLRRMRELVDQLLVPEQPDTDPRVIEVRADRLAEHVQALDEWLSKGGFPPEAWVEPMKRAAATAAAMAHPVITMREWAQDQAIRAAEPLGGPVPGVNGHLPEHADE